MMADTDMKKLEVINRHKANLSLLKVCVCVCEIILFYFTSHSWHALVTDLIKTFTLQLN